MVYQYGVGAWNVEKVEQRHGTNCDLMSCVSPWYHHDRTLTILKISPRLAFVVSHVFFPHQLAQSFPKK